MQQAGNQLVTKVMPKRCLIGLQKGVSKGLKGHLLQAKRALIERQFTHLRFSILELSFQDRRTEEKKVLSPTPLRERGECWTQEKVIPSTIDS